MKLRLCILALSAALAGFGQQPAAAPAPNRAAHQQKLALIRRLMDLTGGDKVADQMMDQMANALRSSEGASSAKFFEEFRKEFHIQDVFDLQIAAYDKYFSMEDVQDAVRFYESPTGRRMIENTPKILAEITPQVIAMSQAAAQRVAKRLQEAGK